MSENNIIVVGIFVVDLAVILALGLTILRSIRVGCRRRVVIFHRRCFIGRSFVRVLANLIYRRG